MKDFHSWVADMQNSIEDKSEFIKPSSPVNEQKPLSVLQKRLLLADALVPENKTLLDVIRWVGIFCVSADGDNIYPGVYDVLGDGSELLVDYQRARTLEAHIKVREKITQWAKNS